jgi:acetylornithine deacetylase/succinyl-diaminopimelate desuccinylase-like protein
MHRAARLPLAALCAVLLGISVTVAGAQEGKDPAARGLEREILEELIRINTSDSAGGTPAAARAVADRLLAAGFPAGDVRVMGPEPRIQNLVARYRGRDGARKPILRMAHLDVVDARKEDWSTDPYQFVEKDGWYYGRGTSDNKAGAAMLVANFIRYRREGFVPERDLIIVLTGDEETLRRENESVTAGKRQWSVVRGQGSVGSGQWSVVSDQEGE